MFHLLIKKTEITSYLPKSWRLAMPHMFTLTTPCSDRMTALCIYRWVWLPCTPLRSLWQKGRTSWVFCILLAGEAGRCCYNHLQKCRKEMLIPSSTNSCKPEATLNCVRNNLDSSCPGDGGCCDDGQSSPCPPLLGAGAPAILSHKTLHAFLPPLKQKHFVQTNHHKSARFAFWNIIIKPSSDFITPV